MPVESPLLIDQERLIRSASSEPKDLFQRALEGGNAGDPVLLLGLAEGEDKRTARRRYSIA